MRFELTTPTLARLCSTPELRPHIDRFMHHQHNFGKWALFSHARPVFAFSFLLFFLPSELCVNYARFARIMRSRLGRAANR